MRRGWHVLRGGYRIVQATSGHGFSLLFKLAVLVYFVFCALLLGVRYLVLPNIDGYKPQIELLAARAIGNPVSIDGLQASWSGFHPRLTLDTVVIHDKSGKPALTLPQVDATLSWWTLLVGELRLDSLEISRPDLEIVRDAEGKLYVAGIFIDTEKRSDGRGADWVLSQHEIRIRDGRLRWNDQLRGAPELALDDVDLVIRNRWRSHRFALQARPPADLAAPLDVRASFVHPPFGGRISDVALWRGELYVDLQETDLAVWRAWLDYPIDLQSGRGSVRAWLDFDHAKVADFTADLSLSQVTARLKPDLEPLRLTEVGGRISMREDFDGSAQDGTPTFGANGHAISLSDFTLRTEDGLFLPPTTISERYAPASDARAARTEIHARSVDLETLADFAERLPLPQDQRDLLANFAPRGVVRDFSVQWDGSYPQVSAYSVRGRFAGLALNAQPARPARPKTASTPAQAAVPAIPGFTNLTGRVEANERGGSLALASRDFALQLPAYFAEPALPFERLDMQASWSFQGADQLLLDVQKFDFAQDGVEGSLAGKHVMALGRGKSAGTVDLSGKLNRVELQKLGAYLPLQASPVLRQWLSGALLGGTIEDVRIRLKGDLAHFPFRAPSPGAKPKGEFSVEGRIVDGRLDYVPGHFTPDGRKPQWPLIEQINGRIAFERSKMEITADAAQTSGTALSKVKAVIPDLAAADPLLTVDGEVTGPLQNFVRFTRDSPVAGWIGDFTSSTSASGNAQLALGLHLPLNSMRDARVRGILQFSGNSVTLMEAMPPMTSATGTLEFNEKGFSVSGIRSSFLGGPVTVKGGTQRDGTILVRADGSVSAAGIRQAYAMPISGRDSDRVTGSTRYSAVVRVRDGHPAVTVESNLAGLGLDFPAPLRKAAADSMPLRFELTQLPSSDSLLLRDQIRLSLGATINAHYKREKPAAKDAQWRVVSGGIGVNAPPPEPESGVYANFNIASLNIDAWRRAVSSLLASAGPNRGGSQESRLAISEYVEPDVLAARATELIVMERKLDNVVVGASHENGVWQANIDSEQASGYVTWSEPRSARGMGRVTARLASLVIPKSAAPEVGELLEGKGDTGRLPALDIVAENFELFGKRFGQLELIAANARGPTGWEWQISKLALTNPDGELKATGRWAGRAEANRSSLDYTLVIHDAGRLLDRFGFSKLLRGGKGKMEGDLSWSGPPFDLDIPSMTGRINLDLASGQFLKVDAASQGAAKLLGVLSLQSLPRRLTLDFRDVFSEGFAFDGVSAAATINQGMAKTENFKMRGVSATVLIDGTADIAKENQDLHVVVIPEINAGAASVVYGLAVNPAIGVGTFLAQLFLREPLMKAFTFEYQVTGPWKEPVVTRLARKQSATGSAANQVETNG